MTPVTRLVTFVDVNVADADADADRLSVSARHEDMEADHWAHLTEVLRQQGVVADALELNRRPHDVVLSERLLGRVGRDPGDAVRP